MQVDLGCGERKKDGYLGVDRLKMAGVDYVVDLEDGALPFETGVLKSIRACHVLEHIHNLIPLMNECHRVLRQKGTMDIRVPLYPSPFAFQDPTHVRFFTENTIKYFVGTENLFMQCGASYGVKHWEMVESGVDNGWEFWCKLRKP